MSSFGIIEGWTSGNPDIDKFIKDTIYDARSQKFPKFLEWIPFDIFTDIKYIGEGEFSKVYSAEWMGDITVIEKKDDGSYSETIINDYHMKVALKRLNGSQNISTDYLNEVFL